MIYSDKDQRLAVVILNKFVTLMITRMRSSDNTDFKLNVKWIFNELDCTEEEFVLALSYIRKYHSKQYHQIDVPSRWDGCAHLEFPELFMDEEAELEALYSFGRFYGEHNKWIEAKQKGDTFTVPKGVATRLIKKGMAKMINYE